MNLICWLFGHEWRRRWRVKKVGGGRLLFCICTRCGAVEVHPCSVR